jgi:hypothetical protein
VEPSGVEQAVLKAVQRAKLFVFLRQHRHELFDDEFQAELARAYADSPRDSRPYRPRSWLGDDLAGVCRGVR